MSGFSFKILKKDSRSRARLGVLKTPHGEIKTPAFVAVGTQGTVKALTPDDLVSLGVEIVLGNTYHLYLRPGHKIIAKLGGLHRFMGWKGPLMTDSGGFQIFSLGQGLEQGVGKIFPGEGEMQDAGGRMQVASTKGQERLVRITDNGAEFISHLNGSRQFFSPEKSIQIQKALGADIIFAFDECTSPLAGYRYTKKALERTHNWAERCLKEFQVSRTQVIFGIVQGGEYKDLRQESARFIGKMGFFGFGIGGSLGKSKADMKKILDWVISLLPEKKPRHLLGIGQPQDIIEAVRRGVDLFDCVWPTRLARNGSLITEKGLIKISNAQYIKDPQPVDKNCSCYTCQNFTRAYLNHLFRAGEILAMRLATIHNLYYMMEFMRKIRKKLASGKFLLF